MDSGLSVIICCYNSAERIEDTLYHLEKQINTHDFTWEVIVVDNASSDNTADIASKSWKRKDVDFQIVFETQPGLSNARLKGISTAKNDILIFVDDDNWLSEDYISIGFNKMKEDQDIGLAGGRGIAESKADLPEWFTRYEAAYAVGTQAKEKGYLPFSRIYLYGAALFMRKSMWTNILDNGFQFLLSGRKGKALTSGEDYEMSAAFRLAGYKLWYDPDLTFKHLIPEKRLDWDYLIKLVNGHGKSYAIIILYISEIRKFTGLRKFKSTNRIFGLLSSLFWIIRLLPSYLLLKINYSEGKDIDYRFNYHLGLIIQRIKLFRDYNSMGRQISTFKARFQ